MSTHRHRAVHALTETKPFTRAVTWPENRAAHGNVCLIQHCDCGAWRAMNVNGKHVEQGPWEPPVDREHEAEQGAAGFVDILQRAGKGEP